MFDVPKLQIAACSNSVQLVPLLPIIISILCHHYKELKECMEDIKQIEGGEEVRKEEELPEIITVDNYFINNKEIS